MDWTIITSSAITAIVIGGSQFIANRYLARMLDRIEKELVRKPSRGERNGNESGKPADPKPPSA